MTNILRPFFAFLSSISERDVPVRFIGDSKVNFHEIFFSYFLERNFRREQSAKKSIKLYGSDCRKQQNSQKQKRTATIKVIWRRKFPINSQQIVLALSPILIESQGRGGREEATQLSHRKALIKLSEWGRWSEIDCTRAIKDLWIIWSGTNIFDLLQISWHEHLNFESFTCYADDRCIYASKHSTRESAVKCLALTTDIEVRIYIKFWNMNCERETGSDAVRPTWLYLPFFVSNFPKHFINLVPSSFIFFPFSSMMKKAKLFRHIGCFLLKCLPDNYLQSSAL